METKQQGSEWCISAVLTYIGSPPLVQILSSTEYRILFITGENAQLIVVTTLKKCFVAENFLYQVVSLCFVSVVVSTEVNRRYYICMVLEDGAPLVMEKYISLVTVVTILTALYLATDCTKRERMLGI